MNELIFFLHLLIVILFSFAARRLGKMAVFSFIIVQSILANLFVIKQMELCGFTVTCSDVYAVGSIIALNVLQEDYEKIDAQRAVGLSFFFLLFFAAGSFIHLLYVPSAGDTAHLAYARILESTPRIVVASIVTTFIVQLIDVQFFAFLKEKFTKTSFAIRASVSVTVAQILDTALFTFLGLYGLVDSPWDVFWVSLVLKLIISAVLLITSSEKQRQKAA